MAKARIYPEKRKGIDKNVPLQLHIDLNGQRIIFNTGYRCNIDQWNYEKRLMNKNTVNDAGQTAATVNAQLKAITGAVDLWARNNPTGTKDSLLSELRSVAGKKEKKQEAIQQDFFSDFNQFLIERNLSENRHEHYLVLKRAIMRFDKHTKAINGYNINLASFEKFLTDEHKFRKEQKQRGLNTVFGLMAKLRSFYLWAIKNGKTEKNPFTSYEMKSEIYGTPFYLSIDERNHIYTFDFSNRPALGVQRDIFIFQCFVGCRVGDLQQFTAANIVDGCLQYVAAKTKDGDPVTIEVPLTSTAIEIIERYKGEAKLLPFISLTHYNEAIKDIIQLAGIDRNVTVLNTVTRSGEQKPIYEVASSHIARRTFIGNLYKKVQDPNIVGSMSGHVEGSRAFARYRTIDKDIKRDTINLIE